MDFISEQNKLELIKKELYAQNMKRIKHIEGVAECAVMLAERHFSEIPEIKVLQAAFMHDFTKEYEPQKHKDIFREYGIALNEYEEASPKLYHAKSAYALAKHHFGLEDDVCNAILYHTTGKANMTPLEKIIFFADYIEPNRTFIDCVDVRDTYSMLYETKHENPLETALLYSLDLSIADLSESGALIHTDTVDARNYLILHGISVK